MTDNPHYVTPEEAKKKVCPSSMGGLLMVHDAVMVSEHECHGPDCMAWRWAEINDPQLKEGQWDDSTSGGWFTLGWKKQYSTTHGYCGMVRS
jgi:hypothetical protein